MKIRMRKIKATALDINGFNDLSNVEYENQPLICSQCREDDEIIVIGSWSLWDCPPICRKCLNRVIPD